MNNTAKGSKAYLFSIVLVAVLGGLLFGYDTAVIRCMAWHYFFQCAYRLYHW